jgi:hypothetical protein
LAPDEAVDLARLAAFAADPTRPARLRAEAGEVLAVWQTPSAFDRVDGSYLGQPDDAPPGSEDPGLH